MNQGETVIQKGEPSIPFSNILAEAEGQPLYTPYLPSGNPEEWSAAYRPLGLPHDPGSQLPPPGLESPMMNYDNAMPAMSGLDGIWDKITQSSESAISWAYHGIEQGVKSGYSTIKSGVSEVVSDVASPVANSLKTTYLYALAGVVVVGAVLYYVGKTGSFKVNARV